MKRPTAFIILAAALLILCPAAQAALDGPGSGLVGWWKFDEGAGTTAADSSGNNNTGQIVNAQWGSGKFGSGLTCTATPGGQYVKTTLPFGSSQWSISMWVNPVTPFPSGSEGPYWGLYTLLSGDTSTTFLSISSQGVNVYWKDCIVPFTFNVNPGWHHIVITYDGSSLRGIIDNSAIGSIPFANVLANNVIRYIGARGAANTHNFNGIIDEVRLYNRVLSDHEIAVLFDPSLQDDMQAPQITQTYPVNELPSWTTYSHVSVQTNEEATCRCSLTPGVAYQDMKNVLDDDGGGKTLSIYQGGLESGQSVVYYVRCRDKAGNYNLNDFPVRLEVAADTRAPLITEIDKTIINENIVDVVWTTDEPSDSQIEYGLTSAYGTTTDYDPSLAIGHAVMLRDLKADTEYHYRVISKDKAGNAVMSADQTFRTPKANTPYELYVAKNGNDSNPGTKDSPFLTIEHARDVVRAFRPVQMIGSPAWVTGIEGTGIYFDGVDDIVPVSTNFGGSQWAMSAWVNPQVPVKTAPPYYGLYTILSGDTSTQIINIQSGGIYVYTTKIAAYPFNSFPGWHHVVVEYDGSNLITFVDGANKVMTALANPLALSKPRNIGLFSAGYSHAFIGSMDEIRLYSRLLSDAEVQSLSRKEMTVTSGMAVYYSFNEGTGSQTRNVVMPPFVEGGITVWIRGGVYELSAPVTLSEQDSGMEAWSVIYAGYPNEEVRLSAGKVVNGAKKVDDPAIVSRLDPLARDYVMQIDLKAQGITDYGEMVPRGWIVHPQTVNMIEPFIAGQPMQIARWPNTDDLPIVEVIDGGFSGKFRYSDDRPDRWQSVDDVWVNGAWLSSWTHSHEKVVSIDKVDKIITTEHASAYAFTAGQPYYYENILEELDSPNEWYLDRNSGILYFWPQREGELSVSMLPKILSSDAAYSTFKNLIFEQSRNTAITLSGKAHHSLFLNCTIRNTGEGAIQISAVNSGLFGCKVYDVGGKYAVTVSSGDVNTLKSGFGFVENSELFNMSRWVDDSSMINLNGVGQRARYNHLHDATYIGIMYNGNNHVIDFNEINDVMKNSNDGGATYSGRSWVRRGSVIRYNYIHDLPGYKNKGAEGVYLDDILDGHVVFGNVLVRIGDNGVELGGGRDHMIDNNIFIECHKSMHVDDRGYGFMALYLPMKIIDASNTTPIVITFNRPHNATSLLTNSSSDHRIAVSDVQGNTAANGLWDAEIVSPTQLRLLNSAGNGEYGGGGSAITVLSTFTKEMNDLKYLQSPYADYYPLLTQRVTEGEAAQPRGNNVVRNIFYQNGVGVWDDIYTSIRRFIYLKDNVINEDPHFVDFANHNFQLQDDSPMYALGFKRIPFEKIGLLSKAGASIVLGDVSGDGNVSAYDAALAAQYAVGLITLTQEQVTRADVSGGGGVSAYDAALIAQRAVGLIDRFPVEG